MADDRETTRGGELSHGYKASMANMAGKTTTAAAKTETKGYRPATPQDKPASRPAPPTPPAGEAGGSQ